MEQEPEEDCRVGKRPMEQQEEGPERKRVQVNIKDALAQWGQRRSAGGEERGLQETKEAQGENKRPREDAPEEESAELPMDLPLIQELQRVIVDVAELCSPPWVNAEAQKFGVKTGEAMDTLTVWDFTKDEHKRMAKECIDKYKPRLIVGSPMCVMFSALQNLTPWTEENSTDGVRIGSTSSLWASCTSSRSRRAGGSYRYIPASATSWSLKEITDVMDMEGVDVTAADQCMFGLKTWGMDGKSSEPAMKQTRFISNSPEILSELTRKCDETTSSSITIGVAHRKSGSVPGGVVQGDLHGPHEGAAQQGVPRELRYLS